MIVGFLLKVDLDVLIKLTICSHRFVLKLKNSVDASAPSSEKDFIALW